MRGRSRRRPPIPALIPQNPTYLPTGFAVSLITKLIATAFQYVIGRFLLHDYIVATFVQGTS